MGFPEIVTGRPPTSSVFPLITTPLADESEVNSSPPAVNTTPTEPGAGVGR